MLIKAFDSYYNFNCPGDTVSIPDQGLLFSFLSNTLGFSSKLSVGEGVNGSIVSDCIIVSFVSSGTTG